MFGISLTEFIVIIIVAMVFIKPDDIPSIIKTSKTILKKFTAIKKEYSHTINNLQQELGFDDEEQDYNFIIDDNGKPHMAYDIKDLKDDQLSKKAQQKICEYN